MENRWNAQEAARLNSELERRVYSSRLLGSEPELVLHGGGNTSVKVTEQDLFGDPVDLLYVKGSGWDLATIETQGFAPVRMAHLLKLAEVDELSDTEMARELRVATVDPAAPSPSVEAILHAVLPYTFVDHTHADAVVTLTNTADGEARVREVYGDRVIVVPYVMPGFILSKKVNALFSEQADVDTVGIVLLNHGIFTFGETAEASYVRMIDLVTEAEAYLKRKGAWTLTVATPEGAAVGAAAALLSTELAALRQQVSLAAGQPMLLRAYQDPQSLAFARRSDVSRLATRGPATPDHVIRTKRIPLIGRDVEGYVEDYTRYFEANNPGHLSMLDPAPRIVIDPDFGVVTSGQSAQDALIAGDIYAHTLRMILRAEALGGWQALSEPELFEMEYWELEQAKLKQRGAAQPFQGEVALVTGAASGIGQACAEVFLKRGSAVIGLDVSERVAELNSSPAYLGLVCDLTDEDAVRGAIERGVYAFGGLDMLVLNAGVFPASQRIAELPLSDWRSAMQINLDANLTLLREAHSLLARAPKGGRVVVNASKNVPAPGMGAAAYSVSKAALTQLARVAALEWGEQGVRVNVLHPDAVFDTGLWTPEVLEKRAQHYGLSVEAYKRRNVLKTEVSKYNVAELAAAICGPAFAKTTGAQVPVDGGNDRVI